MKFSKKIKLKSEIPTASMPDIIFTLTIFFMVSTTMREVAGLNVFLPQARRIEKMESKRHSSFIYISKDGLISIDDKVIPVENIQGIMFQKRVADPQLTVSIKSDRLAKMELITKVHQGLREADALKVSYSSRIAPK